MVRGLPRENNPLKKQSAASDMVTLIFGVVLRNCNVATLFVACL
jgi:hypothetical protein